MKAFLQFLQRAFKYFRNTKRVWRRPPRASLLIIDRGTASPLDEMFAHHKPHIMEIRGESVNMLALFRALPKIHLGAVAYLEAYIDFVKPKLILSRTDNNHTLWQLKRRPNVTYQVALVQNGWRFEYEESLPEPDPKKNYRTDKFFTFGNASSKILARRLGGELVASGSLKANTIRREKSSNKFPSVAFISTFRASKRENYKEGSEFFEILGKLCKKFEVRLVIAGCERSHDGSQIEKDFYSVLLRNFEWQIFQRVNDLSSYDVITSSRCAIVESSSLGYESLSMGLRTGFVAIRERNRITDRFGLPLEFGEKGPFWTNDPSEEEVGRILDYLLNVSDEQWERDSGWIRDQLMVHDYGNTKIRAYVEGVLTDSLESK
jgi:surface carbohydrate biosynthesis protein